MFVVNNTYVDSTSWKILNYMTLKLETTRTYFSHNLTDLYERGPYNDGTKIYNNLPTQIKLLSSNFNQFKKALKYFLHSFYALAENFNYNRNACIIFY
jgi:hypothetical protein